MKLCAPTFEHFCGVQQLQLRWLLFLSYIPSLLCSPLFLVTSKGSGVEERLSSPSGSARSATSKWHLVHHWG